MRRTAKTVLLGSLIVLCAVIALKGAALLVPSGTWAPTANLNDARANSSAALLSDGRILITGGDGASGPLATAEFFNTDGSVSAAAPMNVARSKHVSVVLQDGRVLVAGGTVAGGGATNAAEIYDPVANSWTSLAGGMAEGRSGATAGLLQDHRVFIAGGDNAGVVGSTVEIFDPVAGSFSFAGTLSSPRTQNAMAVLADGRVLIVGGSNGTVTLASTDIFDPVTGSVALGPSLAAPRSGHSATTLLDGRVLVAGGNNIVTNPDGSTTPTDLASAEIFDPAAGTFSPVASNLATPRQGHLAFLLPHNNNVLIVGGTSAGAPVASSELFTPWQGTFSGTGSLTTARSNAAGSAMQQDGFLLVAGGKDANGNSLVSTELYGFATVKTDQADYAPGSIVTITGSGWQPGETVTLSFLESPLIDTHPNLTAVADASGNIFNNQFSPDSHDIGILFYLSGAGSVSQAQTTFTDAPKDALNVSPNNYNHTLHPGDAIPSGDTFTYSITSNSGGTTFPVSTTVALTGAFGSVSPTSGTITAYGAGGSLAATVSGTVPCTQALGLTTLNVVGTVTSSTATITPDHKNTTVNITVVSPSNPSCTVGTTLVLNSVSPNSVPFGSSGPVTFTATLTRNDTSAGVVGATVNFSVDGGAAGSATTGVGGVATFTTYNPSSLSVATHNVAASFATATIGGTNFSGSNSGTLPLAVNRATPTITWANPADITYGTALGSTQLNATASVPGTFVYTPAAGTVLNAGNGQTLHIDFTPTDGTNYNTASKDVLINVQKATPTVNWSNPADITYGTALNGTQLNATFTWVVNGAPVTVAGAATYTPPSGTLLNAGNAQNLKVDFAPTDTTNYNTATKTVQINVQKATPTVNWSNPADITYGTALNGTQLNATFTCVVNGAPVTVAGAATYTPPSGTVLNPGANQSLSVNFAPADTANYNATSMTVHINVGYGICSASIGAGGVILPPINSDGTSVYKRQGGSSIPVKFRVCDAFGNSISNPAAVFAGTGGSLTMLSAVRGTITNINEVDGTDIPDAAFRWDASGQQWIFNMATSNLTSGNTYQFRINLAYSPASIVFVVGVK
jgi:Kelch motif protein